jgi:N6-adenosine-specific RNA methylase IME4
MYSEAGEAKSPQAQYDTMSVAQIKAMPVLDLASENCLLWLWAVNPMLPQALDVLSGWGFEFKTAGTWLKTTKHGKINFGTGYILRGSNEPFPHWHTREPAHCEECPIGVHRPDPRALAQA